MVSVLQRDENGDYSESCVQKFKRGLRYKEMGNDAFKEQTFAVATKCYALATQMIDGCLTLADTSDGATAEGVMKDAPPLAEMLQLSLAVHLNCAAAEIKMENFGAVELSASTALIVCDRLEDLCKGDTESFRAHAVKQRVKALFRRGTARMRSVGRSLDRARVLAGMNSARDDLLKAARLAPQDRTVRARYAEVNAMAKALNDGEDHGGVLLSAKAAQFAQVTATGARGLRPPPVFSQRIAPPREVKLSYGHFYESQLREEKKAGMMLHSVVRRSTMPSIMHGVAPPLEGLVPIELREMSKNVNLIHEGRVLFVKTIMYPALRQVGVTMCVEDDAGDVILLGLYNYASAGENVTASLPAGTMLALLAPFMKNSQDTRGASLMLRCDNPQCVIQFSSLSSFTNAKAGGTCSHGSTGSEEGDAAAWRTRGTAEFGEKAYAAATRSYATSLQLAEEEEQPAAFKAALLSNSALAFLKLKKWGQAREAAQAVLTLEPRNVKANYRLALACIRTQCAQEAYAIAKMLSIETAKEDVDCSSKMKAAIDRLHVDCVRALEEESGQFNFSDMSKEAVREFEPRIGSGTITFHSNFVSPKAEFGVRVDGAAGRGCRAVHRLEEGDLICASKAFAFALNDPSSTTQVLDFYGGQSHTAETVELVTNAIAVLVNEPERGAELYSLSVGAAGSAAYDADSTLVNLALIRKIVNANRFGVSLELASDVVDRARESSGAAGGAGLFLRESLFNHSCTPNCVWRTCGDHIFMFATKSIEAGNELCVSYVSTDTPFLNVVKKFKDWTSKGDGFRCMCPRCSLLWERGDLRDMDAEASAAYNEAADLVGRTGMPMADASDQCLHPLRRTEIVAAHADLDISLQHPTVYVCEILSGASLAVSGDSHGALRCYEAAADIAYAARGGGLQLDRMKDLWRIVGGALRCGDETRANEALQEVWTKCFLPYMLSAQDFFDLTKMYAYASWTANDDYDLRRRNDALAQMAKAIVRSTAKRVGVKVQNQRRGKKKKKKGKRSGGGGRK